MHLEFSCTQLHFTLDSCCLADQATYSQLSLVSIQSSLESFKAILSQNRIVSISSLFGKMAEFVALPFSNVLWASACLLSKCLSHPAQLKCGNWKDQSSMRGTFVESQKQPSDLMAESWWEDARKPAAAQTHGRYTHCAATLQLQIWWGIMVAEKYLEDGLHFLGLEKQVHWLPSIAQSLRNLDRLRLQLLSHGHHNAVHLY